MRRLIQLFDFGFILSSVLLVPWKVIRNITDSNEKIYELEKVDIEPRPMIGREKLYAMWREIMQRQFNSTVGAHFVITFIVYKNGKISDINTSIKDVKLAIKISKVLSSSEVQWLPGMHEGDVVNVRMKIDFKL